MTIIYIASPYSSYANKQAAVDAQIDAFAKLRDLGYEPIAPLLSHYIDQRHPARYERWMQWCLAMVGACDVVLRLPGESAGADRKVAEAKRLGKPVVYGIDSFVSPGTVHEVAADKQDSPGHFGVHVGGREFVADEFRTLSFEIDGKSGAIGTLVIGDGMQTSASTVVHPLSDKQRTFAIDDVRIPPGDYPPINFDDHSHRTIADELSPLHWFGREDDGSRLRQDYTWQDFRREHLAQFEAMVEALPSAGDAPYTWAEYQAANKAALDEIAAFVGGTRE